MTDKLDAATIREWASREYGELPVPKYVLAARYALELSDKVTELEQERETDLIGRLASMNADLLQQVESQAAELERLRDENEIMRKGIGYGGHKCWQKGTIEL